MAQLITSNSEATQSYKSVETIDMVIDEESYGRMIKQSINMYQNAPEAVFREYVTNARDAHIAAGKEDTPIEVWIPEGFDKHELIVKDYGVGLDRDGLQIYVTVGKSTKDVEGNKETGSFGQGCKSALSMNSQFTVVAIKDGIKRFAIIGENDKGGYGLDIVKATETIEPNGVTVKIKLSPAQAQNMREIAEKFLSYWDKGTVLLNGEQPKHYLDDTPEDQKIVLNTGSIVLDKSIYGGTQVNVKMGAVVYPVHLDKLWQNMSKEQCELFVGENAPNAYRAFHDSIGAGRGSEVLLDAPLSSLKLVPSRDALIYTNKDENTVGTLVSLLSQMKSEVMEKAQKKIDAADSYADAEKALLSTTKLLTEGTKFSNFTWNGVKYSNKLAEDDSKDFSALVFETNSYDETMSQNKYSNGRDVGDKKVLASGVKRVVIDASESESQLFSHRAAVRDYVKSITNTEYTTGKVDNVKYNDDRAMRIMLFSGKTIENPWVFKNDNIINLTIEEVRTEAKAYRKWVRDQKKAGNITVRSAETSYDTHYANENKSNYSNPMTVSELPESVKTVVVTKDLPAAHRVRFFMENDGVAFMSIKGGRSEAKLKSNVEAKDIRALSFDEWTTEVSESMNDNGHALRLQARENLSYGNLFKSIVETYEYQKLSDKLVINGINVAEWARVGETDENKRIEAASQIVRSYKRPSLSDLQNADSAINKMLAEVPSNDQIAEKYPMVSVIASNGNGLIRLTHDSAGFKLMMDYINSVNTAE